MCEPCRRSVSFVIRLPRLGSVHPCPVISFRSSPPRFSAVTLVLSFGLMTGPAACQSEASVQARDRINDVVTWKKQITLEENHAVRTVLPTLTIAPNGDFLVADLREAQIRRYSPDGRLLGRTGSEGNGPGQFTKLAAAVRLPSGRIVAVDMSGRLAVFDGSGRALLQTERVLLTPLYDAGAINDTMVALVGRAPGQLNGPLVHIWNLRSNRITRSFFTVPPHPDRLDNAYAFSGWADVVVRGNTAAVVYALTDTVYFYKTDGTFLRKLPIPFQHFRRLREPLPVNGSPREQQDWRSSYSRISQLFWAPDGTIYVQYFDSVDLQPQWRLLGMNSTGQLKFDLLDSPRLLAVSPQDSSLVFLDPLSETPNVWSVARLSR